MRSHSPVVRRLIGSPTYSDPTWLGLTLMGKLKAFQLPKWLLGYQAVLFGWERAADAFPRNTLQTRNQPGASKELRDLQSPAGRCCPFSPWLRSLFVSLISNHSVVLLAQSRPIQCPLIVPHHSHSYARRIPGNYSGEMGCFARPPRWKITSVAPFRNFRPA
jgi:hypothetical protein